MSQSNFINKGEHSPPSLNPLPVGSIAPYFSGIDQYGDFHSLETLKENKPIILFFYRGYWCNLCMEHLTQFQKDLDKIQKKGFKIVVITNEGEEFRDMTISNTELKFPVLIDFNNSIMEAYKVAFPVKKLEAISQKYEFEVNMEFHMTVGKDVLPIPATYLIDKNGKIKFVHFDPDFSKKASLDLILNSIG